MGTAGRWRDDGGAMATIEGDLIIIELAAALWLEDELAAALRRV